MRARGRTFPGRSLRRTWRINPTTRVHDNDIRKYRKKERQAIKKRLAEELRDEPPAFVLRRDEVMPAARPLDTGFGSPRP